MSCAKITVCRRQHNAANSAKSKLMDILEKMYSSETSDVARLDIPQPNK